MSEKLTAEGRVRAVLKRDEELESDDFAILTADIISALEAVQLIEAAERAATEARDQEWMGAFGWAPKRSDWTPRSCRNLFERDIRIEERERCIKRIASYWYACEQASETIGGIVDGITGEIIAAIRALPTGGEDE